jgi:hypothetical protein
MTRAHRSRFLPALLGFCLAVSASAHQIDVPGDPDPWVLANAASTDQYVLTEWLRPGATLADWREMLSTLEIREISSPLQIAEDTKSRLRARCPSMRFEYLRQLPDDVLYVFDTGRCSDDSGPEHELARLTRLPGTRTYKVSWSYRGALPREAFSFWRGALADELGTWQGRAVFKAGGDGGRGAPSRAVATADPVSRRAGDTDAELERCKSAPDPFGCIAEIQERLLAEGSALAEANRRASPATAPRPLPATRGEAIDTDAELERCKRTANPTACINKLQERLLARDSGSAGSGVRPLASPPSAAPPVGGGSRIYHAAIASLTTNHAKPSGGPADASTVFKSTAGQIYAVSRFNRDLGGRTIEYDWRYLSDPAGERSLTRRAARLDRGADNNWSALSSTGLLPTGEYRVDLYIDGELAGQAWFTIERAGMFG